MLMCIKCRLWCEKKHMECCLQFEKANYKIMEDGQIFTHPAKYSRCSTVTFESLDVFMTICFLAVNMTILLKLLTNLHLTYYLYCQ